MPKPTCQQIYQAALHQRQVCHPFKRASAYKVREVFENFQHQADVVRSVREYLSMPWRDRQPTVLQGCTPSDKAQRLRLIPSIIARELGWNLVPAVEALHVEGVPFPSTRAYVATLGAPVQQLLGRCDAVQELTSRHICSEYSAMAKGKSSFEDLCVEALAIAKDARRFCQMHGKLCAQFDEVSE